MTNLEEFKNDPIKFAEEILGIRMDYWQQNILRQIASMERPFIIIPRRNGFEFLNHIQRKLLQERLMEKEFMKKAAIVADNYKLKIFRRNLKNAGFEWGEIPFNKNSTVLKVAYDPKDFDALKTIVEESNSQARGKK